ncbi:MAG: RNA 2',3'-cyclic phosphodiesterase [Thermodesulfovibrionales bacterium]|nr:RNA 2',3'-cyclic phosphodiesterase [Thermodesulfovibrionales bacterium]
MRCFIAIDLPKEIKLQIQQLIKSISHLSHEIRWVPFENLHLTLKFLGEIDEKTINKIQQILKKVLGERTPFKISISGVGAFPNTKKPNVLWVGVAPSEELKLLFEAIDTSFVHIGFIREKRGYSPHLTIGRVKDHKNISEVIKSFNEFQGKTFGSFEVSEIYLMRSILHPQGAEYIKLISFKLT